MFSSTHTIEQELPTTDLVIGAVLIPGAKAPHLITRDMLKLLKPGSVLVDVAIDQGGCFETSHPTTHANPVYEIDDILHYCVANIPGAVPQTSTLALTNATLPYVIKLADRGWEKACEEDPGLELGLNIVEGKIVYPAVADGFSFTQSISFKESFISRDCRKQSLFMFSILLFSKKRKYLGFFSRTP